MNMPSPIAHKSDSARVLTKAVLSVADRLGLPGRLLGQIVGVSEATVSRWRQNGAGLAPESKAFQLAALLVRAYRSLDAIVGGDEAVARTWIGNPNQALGGRPIELMLSPQGLVDVAVYLDARRAPL